ncbi:MAG: polysulfide reductase [Pseudonocardiaceae bacterium]|nr:polysulfide reductase [Pseudonocardiaceae bacterium]
MNPRRGERLMVPEAEFQSYYDQPVIKPPVWKVPDVPAYLYLGGLAGASASMAALADATGRPSLRRVGRIASALGATASVGALIHDLGRPERFLHMLRVFKPTSPLSVGSWILAPFGSLAAAGAASELTGIAPRLGSVAGAGAGLLGPAMTTYTAVLLADTAVPAWHEAHPQLPVVFAGSALASAGGVGLLAGAEAGPARRMAVLGAAVELGATELMERSIGLPGEAYRTGRAATVLRAARALTAAGGVGALLGMRHPGSRVTSVLSGLLLNAGAATTRYGIFEAGMQSARDPKFTVVPQRQRLAERGAAAPDNHHH